eukprot:g7317.t1
MKTPESKMHELTFAGYFVGYSGNLILIYVEGKVVTGHREKTQFFEGIFVGRNPPKTPNPASLEDEVADDVQEVTDAQGSHAHEAEVERGEDGLELIRSERALRAPDDVYSKIMHDFADVKVGDLEVFDEDLPDLPEHVAHEPTIVQETSSSAESVIEAARATRESDTGSDEALDTVDDDSLCAMKVAEYKGKHLKHPDGSTGKVIGAKYKRPRGKKQRVWYLVVQWSDDPNPTCRPEAEGIGHVHDDGNESDDESDGDGHEGEPAPKRRKSMRVQNKNRINAFVSKLITIFTLTHFRDPDVGESSESSEETVSGSMLPTPHKDWPTPKTVFDCLSAPDYKGWWLAMRSEYLSWKKLSVFEVIDKKARDRGRNTYPLQDIWKRKWKPNGQFDKWKLRLCVLGNLFKRGVDCSKNTFAPTVSAAAARLFFAISVQLGYAIWGLDVKTAYLTAKSSGKYYTFFPNVFKLAEMTEEQVDNLHKQIKAGSEEFIRSLKRRLSAKFDITEQRVLAILSSVYGDPAAGRQFFLHFREVLKGLGWVPTRTEQCLYVKKMVDGTYAYLISFVDDAALSALHKHMDGCMQEIQACIDITIEKGIAAFLGMNVLYDMTKGILTLNVPAMIHDVVRRFAKYMDGIRPRKIPATPGLQLTKATDEEVEEAKDLPYQELIGSLCWMITWVRIEASTIMSMLGQHNARWSKEHFKVALGVLKYLEATAQQGIRYSRTAEFNPNNCLSGYSDADLAGDVETRRSRTGKLVLCGGGPVAHQSRLQPVVQLSTAAAETIALNDTAQDVNVIRSTLADMGLEQTVPTTVYEDNQAAVAIANSTTGLSGATKHLQMRDLKIKEMIDEGVITVEYCPTNKMLSDLFTKNLNHVLFNKFANFVTGYNTDKTILFVCKPSC